MTSPRKPSAGFWITVALVAVLVGYPLSVGPACWIVSRDDSSDGFLPQVYVPIGLACEHGPIFVGRSVRFYARLWMKSRSDVAIPSSNDTFVGITGRD